MSVGPLHFRRGPKAAPDDRPSLILIHGAGGSGGFFQPQIDGLQDRLDLIAPDLAGHGQSPGPALSTIADHARSILDLLTALAPAGPVYIGGLSMGGAIALQCLVDAPERFSGGILLATGAKLKVMPAIFEAIRGDFEGYLGLVGSTAVAPNTPAERIEPVIADLRACGPDLLVADFAACDAFDIRSEVPTIACPCLVVGGDEDLLTPPRYGGWLTEHLPAAERVRVQGAGHLVSLERAEEVNRAIARFIDRTTGPAHDP